MHIVKILFMIVLAILGACSRDNSEDAQEVRNQATEKRALLGFPDPVVQPEQRVEPAWNHKPGLRRVDRKVTFPARMPLNLREKSLVSTDYIFTMLEMRADGLMPARLSPLNDGFMLASSLQNVTEMFVIDLDKLDVYPVGFIPLSYEFSGHKWAWPRILGQETLSVDVVDRDGTLLPVSADVLMSISVLDHDPEVVCQKVFVKTLRADLTGQNQHEFVENWFEGPCTDQEVGANHSWESGGGIAIVPPVLRKDPGKLEFIFSMGHFFAMQDNVYFDKLPDEDKELVTAVVHVMAPGKYKVIARGLRNTQGIAYIKSGPAANDYSLLGTDHGPYSGDEINLIETGQHYGWPYASFGRQYDQKDNGYEIPHWGFHDRGQRPIFFFAETSLAVAPIREVRDPVFSERWSEQSRFGLSNILVGAMSRGAILRLMFDGERILTVETISIGIRPRDIRIIDGHIWVASNEGSRQGVLARITPTQIRRDGYFQPMETQPVTPRSVSLAEKPSAQTNRHSTDSLLGDAKQGKLVFGRCIGCHQIELDEHRSGPSMVKIVGRRPSDVEDYNYSNPMKRQDPRWTLERLDAFLKNPRTDIPGTTMSFVGIPDEKDRADLLAYLLEVGGEFEAEN